MREARGGVSLFLGTRHRPARRRRSAVWATETTTGGPRRGERGVLTATLVGTRPLWQSVRHIAHGRGMIIGMGSDLCNIERIQAALDRHGERFEHALLHRDRARQGRQAAVHARAGTCAKRFAAKEAFSKAVGTGFFQGVYMKDIGVVNLPSGAPTLHLENGAAKRLAELTPAGHEALVHLTLTDDHPWAQAFVVIEACPL